MKFVIKFVFFSQILIGHVTFSQISNDAIIITLRDQENIFLDSVYALKIDSALESARNQIDTLQSIHAFPDYVIDELILRTEAAWANNWNQGSLNTGEPYIDSLNEFYNLIEVDTPLFSISPYLLIYAQPLNAPALSELFELHPDIIYAEANGIVGDGDNIELVDKDTVFNLAFSIGRIDCPSGCIYRYYWYVSVYLGNGSYYPKLEEERVRDLSIPILYRWNIPDRYAMTMFENVDSIFDSILTAKFWWIRRHAIEGTGRFFEFSYLWVGEDIGEHWYNLKNEIVIRVDEVIDVLKKALNDPDNDVKTSARNVLDKIIALSVSEDILEKNFSLPQSYPNPFNPSTRIQYAISSRQFVTLKVHDVLGNEVAILVNEEKQLGEYEVEFDGSGLSSGIYFYTLTAGSFNQIKKLILLK